MILMYAHEIFDSRYVLFVEKNSHKIKSIYASKFYEGIGN